MHGIDRYNILGVTMTKEEQEQAIVDNLENLSYLKCIHEELYMIRMILTEAFAEHNED